MARLLFKDPPKKESPRKKSTPDFNEPWVERHAPRSAKELAVHDKKLQELAAVLAPDSATRVLVVSGPAGSGKSTALRVLAAERGLAPVEFHAPEALVGTTSVMEGFRDFLLGAAVLGRDRTLVLIEELPNVFHEATRLEFEAALLDWASEPGLPLVAVSFTEIEINAKYSESLTVPRVLGQLVDDPFCAHVKINPPSATLLKKALKEVAGQEGAGVGEAAVRELSQCGDVRNALVALELLARTAHGAPIRPESLCTRDSTTELFYAVGKVVWTSKKKGSLEPAMERFSDTMDFFNLTVLENYTSAKYQRLPIPAAAAVAEWLSAVDTAPGLLALGALGAAHEIEHSPEDPAQPKRFVPTRFTQFARWRRVQSDEAAKLQINVKNRRLFLNHVNTARSLVLDEAGYVGKIKPPVSELADIDDDLDLDSDLDAFE